ncbi:MAG: GNAT family N-acetyltransferase [Acidimicrobiales bacterium]
MTVPGPPSFWPLFGLVIRTPRLEIRLPRESEFGALIDLIDQGIHDPATMPFTTPFTDRPSPQRERESAQWWWRQRAEWSAARWNFTGGVFVEGQAVGVQDLMATRFAQVRSVETGSWLGRRHQGQGLGREMREAILHLAFAGLGAEEARSGAFEDNAPSLGASRAVGYVENGVGREARRDGVGRIVRLRIDRDLWAARRRDDIELIGLEACLDMFVGTTEGTGSPESPGDAAG